MNPLERYKDRLIALADSEAVQTSASFEFDLDEDGHMDQIEVTYLEDTYRFDVSFGAEPPMCEQSIPFPYSLERQTFRRISLRSPEAKQFNWITLYEKFPQLRLLDRPEYAKKYNAFFILLWRSETFRQDLALFFERGGKFSLVPDGNFTFSPATNTINIPVFPGGRYTAEDGVAFAASSAATLLLNLPHEIGHQWDVRPDLASERKFIDDFITNEVKANAYAFRVLAESGIDLSPEVLGSDAYQLFIAYREEGLEGLARMQRRTMIGTRDLTYVELAWILYQTGNQYNDEYYQLCNELGKERRELWPLMTWWTGTVLQWCIDRHIYDIDRVVRDPQVVKAEAEHPFLKAYISGNKRDWAQLLELFRAAQMPEQVSIADAASANITKKLEAQLLSRERERIRLKNAERFHLGSYY